MARHSRNPTHRNRTPLVLHRVPCPLRLPAQSPNHKSRTSSHSIPCNRMLSKNSSRNTNRCRNPRTSFAVHNYRMCLNTNRAVLLIAGSRRHGLCFRRQCPRRAYHDHSRNRTCMHHFWKDMKCTGRSVERSPIDPVAHHHKTATQAQDGERVSRGGDDYACLR